MEQAGAVYGTEEDDVNEEGAERDGALQMTALSLPT